LNGSLTNSINEATFLAALINGVGSFGTTFGFVVSAMDFNYNGACALNLALFFLSVPGLIWVGFFQVSNTSHGSTLTKFGVIDADGSSTDTSETVTTLPVVLGDEKGTK